MKVSIVIPAYNCEKYISESINSALNQTWENTEIIVIDDGSRDNTRHIAEELAVANEKIKVYAQENSGACKARNFGLTKCSGDYVQFLDGDDLLAPDKIESQMKILEGRKDSIIGCCWIRFDKEIEKKVGGVGPHYSVMRDMSPFEWLRARYMMALHAWLIPIQIINKSGGWNESMICNQDGEFIYRIAALSKDILFDKNTIVFYRVPSENVSVSTLNSREKYLSLYRAAITYKTVLSKLATNALDAKIAIGNYFRDLAYNYYFPAFPDLYELCRQQEEFSYGTVKPDLTGLTKRLAAITGWKFAKRLQHYFKSRRAG